MKHIPCWCKGQSRQGRIASWVGASLVYPESERRVEIAFVNVLAQDYWLEMFACDYLVPLFDLGPRDQTAGESTEVWKNSQADSLPNRHSELQVKNSSI